MRLERGIWPGTIIISLLLHLSLLAQWGGGLGAERTRPPERTTVTRLSFRSVSATLPQPQPVAEQRPAAEANVAPSSLKDERPQKKKARAERVVPPPQRAVVKEPPRVVEPPLLEPAPVSVATAPPPPSGAELQAAALLREQQQNEYLRRLMGHIERHKFYPQAARRRGLQAVVKIGFELLADGQIKNLRIAEGHKLLRSAAEEAVSRALPLPRPPESVATPLAINFSMAYQLM